MKNLLSLLSLIHFCLICTAQSKSEYPQDYFRNPLNIPISLAGNFGECRPNHFHSGLDIKTEGKENLPVFAAADGYVARMRTSSTGFGHALYINHPNGFTTLYAHLNDFAPELQSYLRQKQYEQQDWVTDLTIPEGMFPVTKGQQIAWSGNTGGSMGPHLHFEIRDTETEHPINPQLFGFEISDSRPPVPTRLAIYEAPFENIYSSNPQIISLKQSGSNYSPARSDTIWVSDGQEIGVGIEVNDFMNGSTNTLGLYTAELYLNEELQARIKLEEIGYQETRYLHAYTDYKQRHEQKRWVQCLFRLPGNKLFRVYDSLNKMDGLVQPGSEKPEKLTLVIYDIYGNKAHVHLLLAVDPERKIGSTGSCNYPLKMGSINKFESGSVHFSLDSDALYTDICFEFNQRSKPDSFSDLFQIHHAHTPVHSYFDLKIKPNKPVPFALQDKIVLLHSDGKKETGTSAVKDSYGWYKKSVRQFGSYRLVIDTIPPTITSLNGTGNILTGKDEIRFRATDNLTSIASFQGTINGKWLLFQKRGNDFFYKFDEHCPPGKHTLLFTATDENGNTAKLSYTFIR